MVSQKTNPILIFFKILLLINLYSHLIPIKNLEYMFYISLNEFVFLFELITFIKFIKLAVYLIFNFKLKVDSMIFAYCKTVY
jgi:hypothetical protein